LEDLIHPDVGYQILKRYFPGVDLREYDLDGPPPAFNAKTNGNQSRLSLVTELAHREKLTLRQLYKRLAGARGHRVVVGTPEKVADEIENWFRNEGADGFNIMPPVLPEYLNEFVDLVIPVLQKRGLFRTAYEGKTLRENLGLKRPDSRYAGASIPASVPETVQVG
jgi:N-acetyl-S-(2-succino)cysteine monooxygenase